MLKVVSLTKLLSLGILFLPTVRAVVVAKLSILGILFLTSFILALRVVVVVAKFVKSGILSLIFLILALYIYIYIYIYIFFFSTNQFLLHHLGYLNQQEQVPKSSLSILLSNFLNYFVHFSICQYLIYLH